MEIERKWLISSIPELTIATHKYLDRIYLAVNRTANVNTIINETRLTRYGDGRRDRITYKDGGLLVRTEIETDLVDGSMFDQLVNELHVKPIHKEHYIDEVNDIVFAIVDNSDFIYAEKEFETEEEAKAYEFPYPEVLIRDITYDPDYKMANYWLRTRGNI